MPLIDESGDQDTDEIVRLLMEDHGFFSLENPGFSQQVVKMIATVISVTEKRL